MENYLTTMRFYGKYLIKNKSFSIYDFRYFSTSNVDPLKVYQHKEVEENVFHIEENYFDSWNKVTFRNE